MADTIQMLTGVKTIEISNVKRAANKHRYAMSKAAGSATFQEKVDAILREHPNMSEESARKIVGAMVRDEKKETAMKSTVVKAVLDTEAEGETEFVAMLKSAGKDEKQIEAMTALYRMQKGFADVVSAEDLKAAGLVAKAKKDDDGDSDDKMDGESDAEYAKRLKKKMAKMKKYEGQTGIDPHFTPVHKSADAAVMAKVEEIWKAAQETAQENKRLAAEVGGLVAKNSNLEFMAKAADFRHVPGFSQTEMAKTLEAVSALPADKRDLIMKSLQSTEELTAKSSLFGEFGVGGSGHAVTTGPAGIMAKIDSLAKQLTLKDGDTMSEAQKVRYVLTKTAEGRALYPLYLAEKQAAISGR